MGGSVGVLTTDCIGSVLKDTHTLPIVPSWYERFLRSPELTRSLRVGSMKTLSCENGAL